MTTEHVLVGLTGGIAAYKTLDVMRLLIKADVEVRAILTPHAAEFVTPLTVESLTGHPAAMEMFGPRRTAAIEHIELGLWPDAVLIAPATANFLGKLAHGIADDLLSTTMLALRPDIPVVIAPAMNTRMWDHPAVQRNIATVAADLGQRYRMVEPQEKLLACGELGVGAMAPPEEVAQAVLAALAV